MDTALEGVFRDALQGGAARDKAYTTLRDMEASASLVRTTPSSPRKRKIKKNNLKKALKFYEEHEEEIKQIASFGGPLLSTLLGLMLNRKMPKPVEN